MKGVCGRRERGGKGVFFSGLKDGSKSFLFFLHGERGYHGGMGKCFDFEPEKSSVRARELIRVQHECLPQTVNPDF